MDGFRGRNAMKILLSLAAALALTGCAWFHSPAAEVLDTAPPERAYERVEVADQVATSAERAACERAGGEISREGLLGWEHCVQIYPDAGKVCSDEDDCLGTCRYEGDAPPGSAVEGVCQTRDVVFGCYAVVDKGVLQHALCVD